VKSKSQNKNVFSLKFKIKQPKVQIWRPKTFKKLVAKITQL